MLALAVVLAAGFWAGPGWAQATAPSQLTPPSLRPPANLPGGGLAAPPPTTLQPPPGADRLDVLVDQVVVEGGFPELAAQTRSMAAGLEGRRVSVAEIYAFVAALEGDYAKAGFALARAVVPPQQLLDHGRLRIVVIDGFIATIDVSALPANVREVVAARLAGLINRRRLHLSEIERGLLIAGDLPGITLRSALAQGTAEGTTKLVIEGSQRLVTGSIGVDDRLPGLQGTWQAMGSLALNSLFGLGEQFYTSFGLGADLGPALDGGNPLWIYGGGVVLPLGTGGVTINPEYSHTITRDLPVPGVVPAVGTFDRFALRVSDKLVRTRTQTLDLHAALQEVIQKSVAPTVGSDLSLDRYLVLRAGLDATTLLPWGAELDAGFEVGHGLGGRGPAAAASSGLPLSAVGAEPDFTKINATVHVTQDLPASFQLDVVGQLQSSLGQAMLRAEQFTLTDADSVSGYPIGTLAVDQGETVRAEFSRQFAVSLGSLSATLSPYLFAAGGRGSLTHPTALEQPVTEAGSVGVGLRGFVAHRPEDVSVRFGLELARGFATVPGLRQGWMCNFNIMLNF